MKKYIRSVALHLLRKHIVKQCRQLGGFSWSAIYKILMSLGLPQMEKTAVLDGKIKVYFKDGESMIMEDTFLVKPIKTTK